MGLVTIMRSNYLQLTNGLFFIKDEKGTYERVNRDGTKTRGHASNGFQCHVKSVGFETKTKIVDGREQKESSWRFELIDDNSECFIMDFRSESSTAFRFLNCLASIKKIRSLGARELAVAKRKERQANVISTYQCPQHYLEERVCKSRTTIPKGRSSRT